MRRPLTDDHAATLVDVDPVIDTDRRTAARDDRYANASTNWIAAAPSSYHAPMTELTRWFEQHAAQLTTTDPAADLEDLRPLDDLVGDARVLAIGEGAHFVEEFAQVRARVLRYLVERHGFSVLLAEYGFESGYTADAWLQGDGEPDDLIDIGGALATGINAMLLRWLRDYNATAPQAVGFGGIDLPIDASPLPVLDPLQEFLTRADPDSLPLLRRARDLATPIGSGSAALVNANWTALGSADQNELTAVLGKLMLRIQALEPIMTAAGDRAEYDLAVRHLDAARRLDYMYGVMAGVFSGSDLSGDASVRDRYMADSVHWQWDRFGADTRIVLMAHNMHIQKTPVRHGGDFSALPMGYYLARELGEQYVTLGLTHTGTSVPEMDAGDDSPVGFTVVDTEMGAPTPDSVEAELVAAGLGDKISFTDLRGLPAPIPHIRGQSADSDAPLPEAFDAVLSTPAATVDPTLPF